MTDVVVDLMEKIEELENALLAARKRVAELEKKIIEMKLTMDNIALACHCEKDRAFVTALLEKR